MVFLRAALALALAVSILATQVEMTCPGPTKKHPQIHCGATGTLGAALPLTSLQATTVEDCAATCWEIQGCRSIKWTPPTAGGKPNCVHYGAKIIDMKFKAGASKAQYWNEHCFNCMALHTKVPTSPTPTPSPSASSTPPSGGSSPPASTPCAMGFEYAIYNNIAGVNTDNTAQYPTFDPTAYKTMTPLTTGTASYLPNFYFTPDSLNTLFGNPYTFNASFLVIDIKGYFYPNETGVYDMHYEWIDDIAFFWLGAIAQSGWDRANALDETTAGSRTFIFSLTAGAYTPFRLMFANGGGVFQVLNPAIGYPPPDYHPYLDSSSTPSSQLVTCGDSTAPPFSAWGAES